MNVLTKLKVVVVMFLVPACGIVVADDLNPVNFKKVPDVQPVPIVKDGEAVAAVAVMAARHKKIRVAQRALRDCIETSTGAKLKFVRNEIPDGPCIVIGDCEEAAAAGLQGAEMPPEGFAIKTAPGQKVFIVGNGNGTAWGVFEFLERFVGVRWYWPKNRGGRSVPKTKNLIVDPVYLTDSPSFRMRIMWPPAGSSPYHEKGQNLRAFQTKLRSGNSWPQQLVVHGDNRLKKVKEHRQNEKIWQVTKDGGREHIHPCYSSEATVDAFMKEIRRHYENGKKPRIGIKGNTITVSPADIPIACYCDTCQKLWDEKAGGYGAASEIMSRFVKRLGERLKRDYPEKTILFLPYQNYTLPPDDVDFPDNVFVQICHMPGLAMYKEPDLRKRWQGYIDGWVELTGHPIQDWHYACWPADRTRAPYQYYHTANSYYRRNKDNTVGTFINGLGGRNHWPRFHPTLYCWMKSMWDINFDVDAAMDAYCERMYGDASDTVRRILRIMTEGWEDTDWAGTSFSPKELYTDSYSKETLNRIKKLLAEARKQVQDDELAGRRLEYFAAPYPAMFTEYAMVMEGKGKQPLIVQKVAENPEVDGRLDDKAWEKATPAKLVTRRKNEETAPKYATKVKGVFTLNGITLGFHMAEPEPDKLWTATGSQDTGALWMNDCVEIFLDPPNDGRPELYQWIITAGLEMYDAYGGETGWDATGVRAARHVGKDFWMLEVFIPLSTLEGVNRLGSTEWVGQITRHRSGKNKSGRGENQRLNYESGKHNSSRADFCPIRFQE